MCKCFKNEKFLQCLPYIVVAVVILGVISAWLFYPNISVYLLSKHEAKDELSKLGTYGDSFGALNTLFSGLAFAGIIISILLQTKELRDTRKEFTAQRKQFEKQADAMTLQIFENTFFQLIRQYNEILSSISMETGFSGSLRTHTGRSAMEALWSEYTENRFHFNLSGGAIPKTTEDKYELFYDLYHTDLGGYFRIIYHALKFVDTSSVINKKFYISLLRAQISSQELAIIYLNCLSRYGIEAFKPLVEKYSFFEHLPVYKAFEYEDTQKYLVEAFGSSKDWEEYFLHKKVAEI